MDEPRKKYEKPVLNGLGDRGGQLTDQDLGEITGGSEVDGNCRAGGYPGRGPSGYASGSCKAGITANHECTSGGHVYND